MVEDYFFLAKHNLLRVFQCWGQIYLWSLQENVPSAWAAPDPRWLVSPVWWPPCSSPSCEAPAAWPWWKREGLAGRIPGNGSMIRSPLCGHENTRRPVCGWWTSEAPSRVERLWSGTAVTRSRKWKRDLGRFISSFRTWRIWPPLK